MPTASPSSPPLATPPGTVDPARLVAGNLLGSEAGDRYFDYCLEPYAPLRPWQGKLRGENFLWTSLQAAGCREALREPVLAIQRSLGRDLTVWGVKWDGARLFWELYIYDPQKEDPAARVESLARTIEPWLALVPRVSEAVPYMMASFDLSAEIAAAGRIDELNLYLTGERLHAGRSFKLRERGAELDNTYRFFPAKPESDAVVDLVKASLFVDYSDPRTLARVLLPQLFACRKICVAKKRTCDGIYFSGINVEQLHWFLKRFGYPEPLVGLARAERHRFDHIAFDVGIDYRMEGGELRYLKTSFYGTL